MEETNADADLVFRPRGRVRPSFVHQRSGVYRAGRGATATAHRPRLLFFFIPPGHRPRGKPHSTITEGENPSNIRASPESNALRQPLLLICRLIGYVTGQRHYIPDGQKGEKNRKPGGDETR
ncbi:hypothetical protein NDU88_001200 [Pleurodeles waltl]|uniref:Uncharacterized protein n=1 Tax=Pleurodeles waltl TaxID=8319 RepID=A0AAV7U6K0_PLEWA|nr:hypothetical protein NDU88_001200 [Pleurodeles waltl]